MDGSGGVQMPMDGQGVRVVDEDGDVANELFVEADAGGFRRVHGKELPPLPNNGL